MVKYRQIAALAAFTALSAAAPPALGAPCAGFVDVDDTNPNQSGFCSSIEWIRNRGVTVGCTATEYCPDANVTRMQMAAFMRRLGDTLTPTILTNNAGLGELTLTIPQGSNPHPPENFVCQVGPYAVTNYPRRAIVYGQYSGLAEGPLQVFGTVARSANGGAFTVPAFGMRNATAGAVWTNVTQTAVIDLEVGSSYTFAFLVNRAVEDAGSNNIDVGRCNMTVQIISRTGAASPFDQ